MAVVIPDVPTGFLDTDALWDAAVTFFNAHANMAAFKSAVTMQPKVLQIVRGPRPGSFHEENAPIVVIDLLRGDEAQAAAQNIAKNLTIYFSLGVCTLGGTPEEADKIALRIADALRSCLKGVGAQLGAPSVGAQVGRAYFPSTGWDAAERPNPLASLWRINMSVEVHER